MSTFFIMLQATVKQISAQEFLSWLNVLFVPALIYIIRVEKILTVVQLKLEALENATKK